MAVAAGMVEGALGAGKVVPKGFVWPNGLILSDEDTDLFNKVVEEMQTAPVDMLINQRRFLTQLVRFRCNEMLCRKLGITTAEGGYHEPQRLVPYGYRWHDGLVMCEAHTDAYNRYTVEINDQRYCSTRDFLLENRHKFVVSLMAARDVELAEGKSA